MKRLLLAGFAALSLSGCDTIADMLGMDDRNANRSAGKERGGDAGDGLISNLQPMGDSGPGQDQQQPGQPPEDDPGQTGPQDGAAGGIDQSMLVGRWGDNGSCAQVIQLFANGTFLAPNGGRGNWRVEGDRLILFAGNRSETFRVRSVDSRRMVVEDSNGNRSESTRC